MDFNSFLECQMQILRENKSEVNQLRKIQTEMLDYFLKSEPNNHIVIQAPTGCGKTLVYILYATYIATVRKERVAIVCPTKELQQQVSNTLELLNQRYINIYGSGEYKCPLREKILGNQFTPAITLFCKYIKCDKNCDYKIIHQHASQADIVVTNYNKFLSSWDILAESGKFGFIIFDESHNLEEIAEESMTVEIKTKMLESAKKRIGSLSQEKIFEVLGILNENFNLDFNIDNNELMRATGHLEELIKLFHYRFGFNGRALSANELKKFDSKSRVVLEYIRPIAFLEILLIANPQESPVVKLIDTLNNFCKAATEMRRYYSFKGFGGTGYAEVKGEAVARDMIRNILNRSCKRQCHVSATLGNLKNYSERLSLKRAIIHSIDKYPFDNSKRFLVALTDGYPMNKYRRKDGEPNWEAKTQRANKLLRNILISWPGNTLVFFRSRNEAEQAFNYLSKTELHDRLLFQKYFENSLDRKKLLEKFRNSRGGILFGFGKMDQGLDFPGESLTMVIMYSLPFARRTPQMEKDFQELKNKYGSKIAFEKVDLESGAKKISQLIGRLIRKQDDFGVGIILDTRFYLKYYKWMRMKKMMPSDLDFTFKNNEKVCGELGVFWVNNVGIEYDKYMKLPARNYNLDYFISSKMVKH